MNALLFLVGIAAIIIGSFMQSIPVGTMVSGLVVAVIAVSAEMAEQNDDDQS